MKPLVSIIIPVYKVEKYLAECLDSVIHQTYSNIEMIVIDDGSPDQCGQICDEYAKKDPRIQVVHTENKGLSSARNTGLDLAKGEYVSFIDSDDSVATTFIENLVNVVCTYHADLAICGIADAKESFDTSTEIFPEELKKMNRKEVILSLPDLSEKENALREVVWNKLYKRELFDHICFPNGRLYEDAATIYQVFWECQSEIVFLNKRLYFYRQREDSIVHEKISIKRYDLLKACNEQVTFFQEHSKEHMPILLKKYQIMLKDAWYRTYFEMEDSRKEEYLKAILQESRKRFFSVFFHANCSCKERMMFTAFNVSPHSYYKMLDFIEALKRNWILVRHRVYQLTNSGKKEYLLLGTPHHDNIGDHVIRKGIQQFFKTLSIRSFELTQRECEDEALLKKLEKQISKDATICITGGGFAGSLYKSKGKRLKIDNTVSYYIEHFKDYKVILFPQSLYYEDNDQGSKIQKDDSELYQQVKNLHLFWREKKSYTLATKLFPTCHHYLCPDMALWLLDGKKTKKKHTNGKALCCFRTDKERQPNATSFCHEWNQLSIPYDSTDTVASSNIPKGKSNRYIRQKIEQMEQYDFVVTDRLHGMIMSLLANTPCIVWDNISGKVKGVYETWLTGNPNIQFCDKPESLKKAVKRIKASYDSYEFDKEQYRELESVLNKLPQNNSEEGEK